MLPLDFAGIGFLIGFNDNNSQNPVGPNADTIEDPEQFVKEVHKLLSIFPNNNNATQILDPNPNNDFVSGSDAAIIANTVPKLRDMLRNTPLEKERRSKRKLLRSLTRRLLQLLDKYLPVNSYGYF